MATNPDWKLGGDLPVNRLGFERDADHRGQDLEMAA